MNISKRQKQFIAITSIAAAVTIYSQLGGFGLSGQFYSESPDVELSALLASNKQESTPEAIGRACLPPNHAADAELVGEYRNPVSTQRFQLWELQLTSDHTAIRILGLYGNTCLLTYDERYDDTIGDNLSEEDARQVALVFWQHIAGKVGGIETLQTNFNNTAVELAQHDEAGYVAAEDKWALEALGIQIPSIYVIYDPENPPQPTRSTRGEI